MYNIIINGRFYAHKCGFMMIICGSYPRMPLFLTYAAVYISLSSWKLLHNLGSFLLDYFAEDSSRNIVNGSPKDSSSSDYGSIRSSENTRANGPSKMPNSLGYSLSESYEISNTFHFISNASTYGSSKESKASSSSNASCQAGFGSPKGFDDWLRFLGPCFHERALRFEESFSFINFFSYFFRKYSFIC